MRIAPNGAWAATVAEGGKEIRLWATKDGSELTTLTGHTDTLVGLDVTSSAAGLISVGVKESEIRLWSVIEKKAGPKFTGHPAIKDRDGKPWTHLDARLLDGERYLATLGHDQTLRIWSLETGKEVRKIDVRNPNIMAAAGLDGGIVAVVTDGKLAIVRITTK